MPHLITNGRYVCNREDLKQFLEETCTDLLDRLGMALSAADEIVAHREIDAALTYWHTLAAQHPILRPEDL